MLIETIYFAVLGCVVLGAGAVVTVRSVRKRRQRRRFEQGLVAEHGRHPSHTLEMIGFDQVLRDPVQGNKIVGARGTFDGIIVEVLDQPAAGTPEQPNYLVSIATQLSPEVRLAVKGVATKSDIVIGHEAFDARFVVSGSVDVAVRCLDVNARNALDRAADAGWRSEGGRLVRVEGSDYIGDFLKYGVRAAKAIVHSDEVTRLGAIAHHDPAVRQRRRALRILMLRGWRNPTFTTKDVVMQLFLRWSDSDWFDQTRAVAMQGEGIVEIAEALAERTEAAALPLVGELLTMPLDGEARRALETARDRLRVRSNAGAGALAVAHDDSGGLAVSDPDVT